MNLKFFLCLLYPVVAMSYFLPTNSGKKLSHLHSKYIHVEHYENIEETFLGAIQNLPEEEGVLIFSLRKKYHDSLIYHICEEYKDVYDFSNAILTKKYFLWRKYLNHD